MIIRSRLFWKFFLSIMLVVTLTASLSVHVERLLERMHSDESTTEHINQLVHLRNQLTELLYNEHIDEAAETLLQSPHTDQFLIFDIYGNELLNRSPKDSMQKKHFSRRLSHEFKQRRIGLSSTIITSENNQYYLEIHPAIPFNPLLSPQFSGNVIRIVLLLIISCLVSYVLAKTFTKRIRQLRQITQQLSQENYTSDSLENIPLTNDELGELGKDFQHMAQKIHESQEARKQILSDISHELRSPLARMHIALEIAREKYPQSELHLSRIEKESHRINALITQILHLQRLSIERSNIGDAHALSEPVDIHELLTEIMSDVRYEYQHSDKTITSSQPTKEKDSISRIERPIMVLGDREQLHSAFENVIRNALSHTPAKTTVEVSTKISSHEKNTLVTITVSDRGPGISAENTTRIFEPFTRLDSSRNKQTGGYGLGLSIAKAVIERHRGTITAINNATLANDANEPGLSIIMTLPLD